MANVQVNQEAQRISDCCNKMQNMNDEQQLRQEVQKIRDCCSKIEQQF